MEKISSVAEDNEYEFAALFAALPKEQQEKLMVMLRKGAGVDEAVAQ